MNIPPITETLLNFARQAASPPPLLFSIHNSPGYISIYFFIKNRRRGGRSLFYKLHRLTFISKNVNAQWISWQVTFFYLNIDSLEVTKNRILIKGGGDI
jgi:hypothetical protein